MNRHQRDIDGAAIVAARRIVVSGRVQGVGFRPFIYRIARALDLSGWVRNGAGRVVIHVEGSPPAPLRTQPFKPNARAMR